MLWRTAKVVFQLMGGLGAGLAVIFAVLAWQLSKGPVSLGFLTEHLERELNKNHPNFNLKIGDTILTWAGWERALDIRVLDVTVTGVDDIKIGSVPEAWFSFSGEALLEGKLEARAIEFYHPHLSVRRDMDGAIDIGFGSVGTNAGTGVIALGFFDQFISRKKFKDPMRRLKRVAIIGGAVTIIDEMLKRTWDLPVANILIKQSDEGLDGEISLSLDHDGKVTELVGDGVYRFDDGRVNLNFNFTNVEPALLFDLGDRPIFLQSLEMPVSGTLGITFPIDGEIEEIRAKISGNGGKLKLREPTQQELDVVSMQLNAEFKPGLGVEVEAFDLKFAPDTKIVLSSPVSHVLPLSSLSISGLFSESGHVIELREILADLNGPKLGLSAKLQRSDNKTGSKTYRAQGSVDKVSTNTVHKFWPKSIAPLPREWIMDHIRGGRVKNLNFDTNFILVAGGDVEVVSITGGLHLHDVVVDYLPPHMPIVKNVSAKMKFDKEHISIKVETGISNKLELLEGRILITGLDQIDQFADIDMRIKGGVSEQLAYIDQKPFQFATKLGLDVNQAEGDASTRLKLNFILERELSFKQIKLWARSNLIGVRVANLFQGYGIDNGDLSLRLDAHGLNVKGLVEIEKIPTNIVWQYNFSKDADFLSKYTLNTEIRDLQRLKGMDATVDFLSNKFLRGGVKPNISYTVFDLENRRLRVTADITNSALNLPAFGWSKEVGQQGKATFIADFEGDLISDVPEFSLTAPGLEITGKARFSLDGSGLEKVEFSRFSIGRTEMAGALIPKTDGSWEAGFHGPVFDLSPIWEEITIEDKSEEAERPFLERLTLAAEFKKVLLNDSHSIEDLSGTFVRADNRWHTILMSARVGRDATFDLQIQSRADNKRTFSMHAQNAGKVLKVLDLYPNMIGGELYIKGIYDDLKTGQPLSGHIVVDNYRIINAPALAHVLSIMSLTGILEALQGPGLGFTKLNIPFEISHGVFRFKDANATGTSIGFTASGKVFRHTDIIDLSGTMVPAYLINSVFGRIPVLGNLLTGGEKGGGVFAANYTMTGPMEAPVVSVNPLSALTPGFLRNVFDIFSDSGAEQFNGDGMRVAPSIK